MFSSLLTIVIAGASILRAITIRVGIHLYPVMAQMPTQLKTENEWLLVVGYNNDAGNLPAYESREYMMSKERETIRILQLVPDYETYC